MPSAVVLSFDHLRVGHLGCYGNEWIETPSFDRLATQGIVFDRHFAHGVDTAATLEAWWGEGRRGTERERTENQRTEIPSGESRGSGDSSDACLLPPDSFLQCLPADVRTWLFVESDGSDSHFVAPPFQEVVSGRGIDSLERPEEETPFAQLVRKLIDRLPDISLRDSTLLWIKARGVPTPWLPPHGFADLYLDEFGLSERVDDESEGDERDTSEAAIEQKYARALYAAYVTWLDRWTGKLLRTLAEQPGWNESLLIVTAAAGQNLGEHGPIGEATRPLREALLHTPLLIRHPDRSHDGTRRSALVQPRDVPATLREWFRVEPARDPANPPVPFEGRSLLPIVREEVESLRDTIFFATADERGVRTEDYYYVESNRTPSESEPSAALLFEKPVDRWDQADLASQSPDVVESLREKLYAMVESSRTSRMADDCSRAERV